MGAIEVTASGQSLVKIGTMDGQPEVRHILVGNLAVLIELPIHKTYAIAKEVQSTYPKENVYLRVKFGEGYRWELYNRLRMNKDESPWFSVGPDRQKELELRFMLMKG